MNQIVVSIFQYLPTNNFYFSSFLAFNTNGYNLLDSCYKVDKPIKTKKPKIKALTLLFCCIIFLQLKIARLTTSPAITDKSAQQYGNNGVSEFRYTSIQTVTVYSKDIKMVRVVSSSLSELGKQDIVFTGGDY